MLTAARLKQVVEYDRETGVFLRVKTRKTAGHRRADGYRLISVDGVLYYAHRLAFLYVEGRWPIGDVDHKNAIPGDDWWSNLREATHPQNLANAKRSKANRSGHKGVHWSASSKKWCSQIMVRGTRKHLGHHTSKEAARSAYASAAAALSGQFARTA